jgi:hypothetical protein
MFARLLIWRDADRDGKCRSGEVCSLAQTGLSSLDVVPVRVSGPSSFDRTGNQIPLVASFRRTNSSTG